MGKSIGIYNYALNLFKALSALPQRGFELHLTCNGGSFDDFDPQAADGCYRHRVLESATPTALQRQCWMRWGAARTVRALGAEVYFTPKGFLPGWVGSPSGFRTVAVVHDLIPLWYATHQPGYFSFLERVLVNGGLVRAARHADQLIAISQATADDIAHTVGRDISTIDVIYNGVPPPRGAAQRPVTGRYLFAVASALPHKNLAGVLALYRRYRAMVSDPLPLVVCGGAEGLTAEGVTFVRGISDELLHAYYAHAEVFVFLSLIEGFGFPPLEAMQHGVPVLCSNIPSLREVTAGAACLVSPSDPDEGARALASLLTDPAERCVLAERGRGMAARYSWDDCARQVAEVLMRRG